MQSSSLAYKQTASVISAGCGMCSKSKILCATLEIGPLAFDKLNECTAEASVRSVRERIWDCSKLIRFLYAALKSGTRHKITDSLVMTTDDDR